MTRRPRFTSDFCSIIYVLTVGVLAAEMLAPKPVCAETPESIPAQKKIIPSSSDAVTSIVEEWADFAKAMAQSANRSAGRPSLTTIRTESWVTLAMFEAINSVDREYRSYIGFQSSGDRGSEAAAAVAAAYGVLTELYPSRRDDITELYQQTVDRISEGKDKELGLELGRKASKLTLKHGGMDANVPVAPYRPLTTPGVWVPTTFPVIEPFQTAIKPWFLSNASEFRPKGPPPLSSKRYAKDLNEVKRYGAKDGSIRSIEQTQQALFWNRVDLFPVLRQIASIPGRSAVRNARMYALVSMALDDADLATEEAKMHYARWRPITAIRNADRDGNPLTQRQADWVPLLDTPVHPEYPCWHCVTAATFETVLQNELGSELASDATLSFTSQSLPNSVRELSLQDYAQQVPQSRIYAGLHFRYACEAGAELGRNVGKLAATRFAPRL